MTARYRDSRVLSHSTKWSVPLRFGLTPRGARAANNKELREGLDETLTVLTLKLSPRLRRSLATTNAAGNLQSAAPGS